MTTTPLPPLPPVEKEWCEDSCMYVQPVVPKYGSYEMRAYATQARADLEAEVKRLREALRIAHDHIDMNALRVSHCKDAATITAALKEQP